MAISSVSANPLDRDLDKEPVTRAEWENLVVQREDASARVSQLADAIEALKQQQQQALDNAKIASDASMAALTKDRDAARQKEQEVTQRVNNILAHPAVMEAKKLAAERRIAELEAELLAIKAE